MSSPSSTDESRAEAHDDPFHLSSARTIVRPSCSLSEVFEVPTRNTFSTLG
jgi:hypothetical protein